MTTDIIKNFYICAYEASEILETTFGRHLDIGEFDEFVYSLYTLSDVDIEKCHNLINLANIKKRECNEVKYKIL